MTRATLAALFILGISIWYALAMMALGASDWIRKSGNSVRASIWVGASVLVIVTLFAPTNNPLAGFRTEAISIAITVIVIDELGRYRAALEEKERIIRQMGSHSNDFALEAVRLAEAWKPNLIKDGSLVEVKLRKANLKGAELFDANMERAILQEAILEEATIRNANLNGAILWKANLYKAHLFLTSFVGADLRGANLDTAMMVGTNLQATDMRDATLCEADLRCAKLDSANLNGAKYSRKTQWPEGFDYEASGAMSVEWDKNKQEWVPSIAAIDLVSMHDL